MKLIKRIGAFLALIVMMSSFIIPAEAETYGDILKRQYGQPVIDSEMAGDYDDGVTVCYFPGEGIVILYKASKSANQIMVWEVYDSRALESYVSFASSHEAVKTVYFDYSSGDAKQYPSDFSSRSAPNAKKFSNYQDFLRSLTGSNPSNPTAKPTAKKTSKATAKPTAKPTKKPTPKPTKKPTPTPTKAPSWGPWSGWSTTPVTETSTRQVQTNVETTTTVSYTYKHWHYTHRKNGAQNSYAEYKGSEYVSGSGKWEYYTTSTPLKQTDTKDGHKRYKVNGVSWYWETKNEKTETVVYYRYRDLQ